VTGAIARRVCRMNRIANISGVENVLRALQCLQSFRAQQAVCVGNDGNAHGLKPDRHTRARIEIVAQSIADEVEREYTAHHSQRGEDDQVRGIEEM